MRAQHSNNASPKPISGSMLPGFEDRLISDTLNAREVPQDVFCYARPDLWKDHLWRMLDDQLTDDVQAAFLDDVPEYVVSDDLSWLDDIIGKVEGSRPDIKSLAADRLAENYRAFRMFHATRTNDLSAFYTKGLRHLTNQEIEDIARSIFLNGRYPGVDENTLDSAIEELNNGYSPYRNAEAPRLYCCADERDFITRWGGAGHYLDFGSEYLYNLGIRLVGPYDAQKSLRQIGSPTLFVIDAPMHLLSQYTLSDFAGGLLEYIFCDLSDNLAPYTLSPGSGSAVILRNEIPADAFVGHFHPEKYFHNL
jgi:hypothetical protein